jgi:hypothetical protein
MGFGTISLRGARVAGFALGDDPMPTGYDLLAQGYAMTLVNCAAGQTCYALTLQTVAGPATRAYVFNSPDPSARAVGTSASTPAGQPAVPPASAGVAPVVSVTAPTVSVTPTPTPAPQRPKRMGVDTKAVLVIAGTALVTGYLTYRLAR